MDGYGNLIAARLRKLAVARSTGMLPFSGDNDGAIYFKDGKIVFAESKRTPGPAIPEGLHPVPRGLASPAPADPAEAAEAAEAGSPPPFSRLSTLLMVTEPTVDAALELLSSESRYAKFRSGTSLSFSPAFSIPLEWLLAEVARRQQLLGQLSGVLTPDTTVVRNPQLSVPGVQVSAGQWALLIRVRDGATPCDLAWELGRSVFSTTAEVYRLLVLRLLSAAAYPAAPAGLDGEHVTERNPAILSFIRAVSGGKGGN